MPEYLEGFSSLPAHGLAALLVLLLYVIQSEIRFGARARSHAATASDRGSTIALSAAALVPVLGFALAIKVGRIAWIPRWFATAVLPAMPLVAWIGVVVAAAGLAVRLWAVLTLRERYTRTLLTHDGHALERRGPYRWVRHPGYLGSLLCLNGIALASGNWIVLASSLLATFAAYRYRIRVEDLMLLRTFGDAYASYKREVGAIIPMRPAA